MAGSIFSEWKNAWDNNAHRSIEFSTLSVNTALGAVGQETSFIDIPNYGSPIFAIRLRLNGNMTTDANTVRFATNIPGRAFDIRIYKPDGRPLIYLSANGGVRVHSIAAAVNDTISPGDPVMFGELFSGKAMESVDRISGRLGPQTGNGSVYCDIIVPCYIPQDAGTHKLQLRNATFTWAAATGTVYATNPGNVPAVSTWTLELIEEMLPVGATMSYFGCTNPQTIGLVVGDNYLGQYLNRGQLLKALVLQSALPSNMDDLRLTQDANQILDTEFEDAVSLTTCLHICGFNDCYNGAAYGSDEFTAAAIIYRPHRNVVVVQPGDLYVTEATQLHCSLLTAAQNMRMLQIQLMDLPRVAQRTEVISTQAAPSTPVVAVNPNPNTGAGGVGTVGGRKTTLLGNIFSR